MPRQKTGKHQKLFDKDYVVVTHKERQKVETAAEKHMKNYEAESSKGKTEQLGVMITTKEFDEIFKDSKQICPGLDKICSKLLRELPKNV